MSLLPKINQDYLMSILEQLLNIPSPTGYTEEAIAFVSQELEAFKQIKSSINNKGALISTWKGDKNETPRALTAHVDTLGAMVKEIKANGRLKLSPLGGFAWNTVEGEGCWVMLQSGNKIRGALLANLASAHVHAAKVNETKRADDTVEVRLDVRTQSADETRKLGVNVGDFVAFDPRVEITNGFIRSRHLDDKAGVAAILAAIEALDKANLKPSQDSSFLFSNYEEVGHGAATGFPENIVELLTVDMAAVGEGQASDEFHATLCVKDSGGPYHHAFSQRLRILAEKHEIAHKIDIYPYYGSDGEAFWRAGADVQVALMGPGLDASHNYERTHMDALMATTQWIIAYLLS